MTSLALEQLLNNKKSSSFILINDTIRFSSLPFLLDFGKRALAEPNGELIVLLTETSPDAWRDQLPNHNKTLIIDAYSDPYGWDEAGATIPSNVIKVNNIKDMEKTILEPIIKKALNTPNCTLLVDSLIPLALISQHRTYQLVKALSSLTTDATRLIIGFHSDMKIVSKAGLSLEDSLKRMANVILRLESLKERTHFDAHSALTMFVPQETFSYLTVTSNHQTKGGLAHIEWRKKSGKVHYGTEGFVWDAGVIEVVPVSQLTGELQKEQVETEMEVDPKKSDPTANLSFNLSLTDEQRKTKEGLVLPFMKAQNLEVSVEEEKKGGLIYYDPDAADDFDDEDPDEDLDI